MEATIAARTASVTTRQAQFVVAKKLPEGPGASSFRRFHRFRRWTFRLPAVKNERLRALVPWLKFIASGMSTWALEMGMFLALQNVIGLVPAVLVARTLASAVNFLINKFVVFGSASREELRREAIGYATVASCVMIVNALGVQALVGLGLPSWLAKTMMDASGSIINFTSQRLVIFSK